MESAERIKLHAERTLQQIHAKITEIEKSMPSLLPDEAGFIRARVEYLTPAQRELFADVLNSSETPEVSSMKQDIDLVNMNYSELKALAKELNINPVGVKTEDLRGLIADELDFEIAGINK